MNKLLITAFTILFLILFFVAAYAASDPCSHDDRSFMSDYLHDKNVATAYDQMAEVTRHDLTNPIPNDISGRIDREIKNYDVQQSIKYDEQTAQDFRHQSWDDWYNITPACRDYLESGAKSEK